MDVRAWLRSTYLNLVTALTFALGVKVEWETEKDCFETFAAALADFYAIHPPLLPDPSDTELNLDSTSKPPTGSGMDKSKTYRGDV